MTISALPQRNDTAGSQTAPRRVWCLERELQSQADRAAGLERIGRRTDGIGLQVVRVLRGRRAGQQSVDVPGRVAEEEILGAVAGIVRMSRRVEGTDVGVRDRRIEQD